MLRAAVRRLLLLLPLLWAGFAWGIDPYVTGPVPALAFSELPKYISDAVEPGGIRLLSNSEEKQTPICDVWLSKRVSVVGSGHAAPDIAYRGIKPGTFVGVISVLGYREDFQHHLLRPGLYTMRYAQLQQDDDDHAVSPYKDFVILSPAWLDKDLAAIVPFDVLSKRGTVASHHDEPAAMSLIPANPAYKKLPAAIADDRGFCTLQVNLPVEAKGKSSHLEFAIIVVRPMWENEGS